MLRQLGGEGSIIDGDDVNRKVVFFSYFLFFFLCFLRIHLLIHGICLIFKDRMI